MVEIIVFVENDSPDDVRLERLAFPENDTPQSEVDVEEWRFLKMKAARGNFM